LLGHVDSKNNAWKTMINELKKTNSDEVVPTWNWSPEPTVNDGVTKDFMFFPNSQCASISPFDESLPKYDTDLLNSARMAPLLLASNEPDQPGMCQFCKAGTGDDCKKCWSYNNRTTPCLVNCAQPLKNSAEWPGNGGDEPYKYDVTGCGMWPLTQSACKNNQTEKSPFPFECFGKWAFPPGGPNPATQNEHPLHWDNTSESCSDDCKNAVISDFKNFYKGAKDKGYSYASTPLVASDLKFIDDLMKQAGCAEPKTTSLKGKERLEQGCPTHSGFHFYTDGCPRDGHTEEQLLQGFIKNVETSRKLNIKYNLDGTIVNEVGSLIPLDNPVATCDPKDMASMMAGMFSYLEGDGSGVVSQMIWFNQDHVGGTYDLRLVDENTDKNTILGNQYIKSCQSWAKKERSSSFPDPTDALRDFS